MAKNTYKQDEVLEEPFDIKHLLRASSYIKKYAKRMVFAILLSGIGGASGYVAPMIIRRKTRGFYFLLWECWSASIW